MVYNPSSPLLVLKADLFLLVGVGVDKKNSTGGSRCMVIGRDKEYFLMLLHCSNGDEK